MRNEKTSERVAAIAGRVLAVLNQGQYREEREVRILGGLHICTVDELKALAASALTQAPDKPKPAPATQVETPEPVKAKVKAKTVKTVGKRRKV